MNLYIFRHGVTYFSKNNLPYGDKVETAEILPEGLPIIKRLGDHLKNFPTDANFTSPFIRCVRTSGIVSEITGKKFEKDTNLRDWDPQKETVEEMIERIYEFSTKVEKKFQSVAVCTHGYPINALIAYFTKGNIEKKDLDNFPDPGILVTIEDENLSYKDFNFQSL